MRGSVRSVLRIERTADLITTTKAGIITTTIAKTRCSHCGTPLTQGLVTAYMSAGEFLTCSTPIKAKRVVTSCCLSSEQMPSSVWLQPCKHIWRSPPLCSLRPRIYSASINTKPRTCTSLQLLASIFCTSCVLLPRGWCRFEPCWFSVAARTAAELPKRQVWDEAYKPSQRLSYTDYKSVRTAQGISRYKLEVCKNKWEVKDVEWRGNVLVSFQY